MALRYVNVMTINIIQMRQDPIVRSVAPGEQEEENGWTGSWNMMIEGLFHKLVLPLNDPLSPVDPIISRTMHKQKSR